MAQINANLLTDEFLANGGILVTASAKVYLKGQFLLLFYATGELSRLQASKRSTNSWEKTLAEQKDCKMMRGRLKK